MHRFSIDKISNLGGTLGMNVTQFVLSPVGAGEASESSVRRARQANAKVFGFQVRVLEKQFTLRNAVREGPLGAQLFSVDRRLG
jgi:hypothetical protein